MARCESSPLQVVPIYFCYFTLGSILAGAIVMQEAVEILETPWKIPIFLIGAALLLFGVWIVTLGAQEDEKDEAPSTTETLGETKDSEREKEGLVVEPASGHAKRPSRRLSDLLPVGLADQLEHDDARGKKQFDKSSRRTSLTPGGASLCCALSLFANRQ